jgi:hypothetical protein
MSRAALARSSSPSATHAAKAGPTAVAASPLARQEPVRPRLNEDARTPGSSGARWSLSDIRIGADEPPDTGLASSVREAISSPGRPLDPGPRTAMETRFGRDFGDVRVHTGADAARSATSQGAGAYTVGNHVVFGPGYFAPQTPGGQAILAHELAHVTQQAGSAGPARPGGAAAEAEAHAAGESMGHPGAPIRIRQNAHPGFAAMSIAEARRALWSHVPDDVKDYVRPIAREAAAQMDKVIPPNTEIPKPIEHLAEHPIDTVVDAVEHPIEAAKSVAKTAADAAPVLAQAASKVTQVVKAKAKKKVHDVVLSTAGVAKGVALEAANIVDTVAWVPYAAHELEKKALGDSKAAKAVLKATDYLTSYAALSALAEKGYAAVDPITHKPTGQFAISGALSQGIDAQADKAEALLGDGKPEEGLVFTEYEAGELKGAIGTQVGLAFVGVEEAQLVLKGLGAVGGAKSIYDAYEANPKGWKSDLNFWAGVIGLVLTLIGLGAAKAAKKIIKIILAGPALAGLVPPVAKLVRDYRSMAGGPERDKALKQDFGAFLKATVGVVMAVVHPGGRKPGAEPEATGAGGGSSETTTASPTAPTGGAPNETPVSQPAPTAANAEPIQSPAPQAAVTETVAPATPVGETHAAAPTTEPQAAPQQTAGTIRSAVPGVEAPTAGTQAAGAASSEPVAAPAKPAATARLPQSTAASEAAVGRIREGVGSDRTMSREDWKAAHAFERTRGSERWNDAVEQGLSGDAAETAEVPRVTGTEKSGYRIGDKRVPREPKARVDIAADPKGRDASVPVQEGETPAEAVARVRQVIGVKISEIPVLEKLWNEARAQVEAKEPLTASNYEDLYNKTRDAFWTKVKADAAATAALQDAGIDFASTGKAPRLQGVDPKIKKSELIVSLDHIEEKAQGNNWTKALDAANLRFEFSLPNSMREIIQARHTELRTGAGAAAQ